MNPRLTRWPVAVLTALDRLANAVLLGDDRLTISSRAYEASLKGRRWGCVLCGLLERVQADHCRKAAEFDAAVATVIVIRGIAPKET